MKNWQKIFRKSKKNLHLAAIILIGVILAIFGGILKTDYFSRRPARLSPSPHETPLYNDFHLIIPVLNLNAPIVADVDGANRTAYNQALENGVAQLKGSAKPGEGSNIFIFGHSSFYWYKPGNYKEIFKNLADIKKGDEIILWYNQKEFKYKVTETKVVSPSKVDVLQPTPQEQVTLMTCIPPGTTRQRLIVIAQRI